MNQRPLVTLLVLAVARAGMAAPAAPGPQAHPVKNVIFLLCDGAGPETWPLLRWVKQRPLAVDSILTGAVRTYGADSIITDSAPGATAYATGFKGSDKGISVGPWHITIDAAHADPALGYVPLATVLEGARVTGRATGVVATSNVQHATPAAFTSHWPDRASYAEIAEQQVYQGIDVVLGGGSKYLLPNTTQGGARVDGENLVETLKAKGYSYVTTAADMDRVKSGKLWGAFALGAMAYDIDRARLAPDEPSLAEMTAKAISLLSTGARGAEKGFFLFVEGSKVDWAAHLDDPAGLVSDLGAFDDAVAAALNFARDNQDTLVIAVADHGTGGVSIGTLEDENYVQTDDDAVVGPLRKVRRSAEGLDSLLQGDPDPNRVKKVIADEWGIDDLLDCELTSIVGLVAEKRPTMLVTARLLSRRARIGWTTLGHTGADVFLFAYGPGRPTGLVENAEVGSDMAAAMGFTLSALNQRLFVDGRAAFAALGYETSIDRVDSANPVFVVAKGKARAEMPFSKNLLRVGGKATELEGLVVSAEKLGKVFLPRQAVDLVKAQLK